MFALCLALEPARSRRFSGGVVGVTVEIVVNTQGTTMQAVTDRG